MAKSMAKSRRGRPPHGDVLTPAEWRVVHAVKHGLSNREIARRWGHSLDAVKYHVANAVQKLGMTSRKELQQWHRAPRGSALSMVRFAKETAMKETAMKETVLNETPVVAALGLGGLAQIARSVRDIKESQTWYRDVLQLPHLFSVGTLAFFDCDGTRLMLSQESTGPSAESLLYWRVADIAAAHAALTARGVEFINAPHLIFRHPDGTEEWLCNFKDVEGRPLGLIARVAP
jgi:DNA-binding CsgD family transcriptional regulator/catechol 2,3-dioxygenase-like lactoylglutathione lyase family enzyme